MSEAPRGAGRPASSHPTRATLAAVALLLGGEPGRADLGSCSGSADSVAFGSLNLAALQGASAVGDQIATCPSGLGATSTWNFCGSIGVGSNSVSQADRRMSSGSNAISYQLYTDAGFSTPFQYPGGDLVDAGYASSSGVTVSIPIYAKILSSAASIPPGTYTDTYSSGSQAAIANDGSPTNNAASECTGASGVHPWNATPFTVSVTLAPSCSVSASALNFGVAGVLSANVDAATNLSVTCTYTTPYSVALSAGDAPGATTSSRAMTQGGSEVFYSLYRDASRTLNWGSNLGVDTYAGIGTGAAQSVPVYGRVPPQATPPIGDYADTVVVTINY